MQAHAARMIAAITLTVAGMARLAGQADPQRQLKTFTAPRLAGLVGHTMEALLYNPTVDEVSWRYPLQSELRTRKVEPRFAICGSGLPDGSFTLHFRIEDGAKVLHEGKTEITITHGFLEKNIGLPGKYPQAKQVAYELTAENRPAIKGVIPLRWSRFRGRLQYLDGMWRPSDIYMYPNGFRSPLSELYVPVASDGTFDALVPARTYSVINVNGAGYSYDSMERWAWDYDLNRDREDLFTLGRTELYAMHAFDINGPIPTVFVAFRPTALSRVLAFDANGDGWVQGDERKTMMAAMKDNPTVIGPELEAKDVKVWLNGKEERIVQFSKIPEFDGEFLQVQYLLQIFPTPRPERGVWHEIKVEVRSTEKLRGKEIVDFGQGSVGFYRP